MHKRISSIRVSQWVFIMCWVAYASAYIGRINYSTALASMINDSGFAKSDAGLIGTAFFFCYGAGQLISGMFGDKFSSFKMIMVGLTLSAVANLAMSFCESQTAMIVIWGFNGVAQSMLWSPMLYIFANMLHPDLRYKACLYIATSVPAGTVLTYLISMFILRYSTWNMIYRTSGFILLGAAVAWLLVSRRAAKFLVPEEDGDYALQKAEPQRAVSKKKFFALLMASGVAIMLISTMIHGMLKEGVAVWVPTMISEMYNVSASFSVFLSMLLPIVSLTGPYIIAYIYKKWLKQDEAKSAALCMIAVIPPICVLLLVGKMPILVSVIMLALITTIMHAFNYMMITMVPVRFAPYHKTSTVTGLLNSITYMGCALSTYGFGFLSQQFGWKNTVVFWVGLALLGVVICGFTLKRWKRFIQT